MPNKDLNNEKQCEGLGFRVFQHSGLLLKVDMGVVYGFFRDVKGLYRHIQGLGFPVLGVLVWGIPI